MPGISGGHIRKAQANKREKMKQIMVKEPYLTNSALSARFGVSMSTIQEVRRQLVDEERIEKITTPYVSNLELRGRFNAKVSPWIRNEKKRRKQA